MAIERRLSTADPGNTRLQDDIAGNLQGRGDILVAQKDFAAARKVTDEEVAIMRRVTTADPSSGEFKADLASVLMSSGEVLKAVQGRPG